jgi:hypothetical protein
VGQLTFHLIRTPAGLKPRVVAGQQLALVVDQSEGPWETDLVVAVAAAEIVSGCVYYLVAECDYSVNIKV